MLSLAQHKKSLWEKADKQMDVTDVFTCYNIYYEHMKFITTGRQQVEKPGNTSALESTTGSLDSYIYLFVISGQSHGSCFLLAFVVTLR